MKTIEITLDRDDQNSARISTLTNQPIYADGTLAKFGDGRDSEEKYVVTIHVAPKIGHRLAFVGSHSLREIYGRIDKIESIGTNGDTRLTLAVLS